MSSEAQKTNYKNERKRDVFRELDRCRGEGVEPNLTRIAELLGMPKSTAQYWWNKYFRQTGIVSEKTHEGDTA